MQLVSMHQPTLVSLVVLFTRGGPCRTGQFFFKVRTAVIKDDVLYVQAGGGVVADSEPTLEWEETLNKARAMFRAAAMVLAGEG